MVDDLGKDVRTVRPMPCSDEPVLYCAMKLCLGTLITQTSVIICFRHKTSQTNLCWSWIQVVGRWICHKAVFRSVEDVGAILDPSLPSSEAIATQISHHKYQFPHLQTLGNYSIYLKDCCEDSVNYALLVHNIIAATQCALHKCLSFLYLILLLHRQKCFPP